MEGWRKAKAMQQPWYFYSKGKAEISYQKVATKQE
jgi:hypothetical protein